jgi:hypothetical protein
MANPHCLTFLKTITVNFVDRKPAECVELKKDIVMKLNSGGMQRYLLTVEYLGTRFQGWQKQKNRSDLRTVQGALEVSVSATCLAIGFLCPLSAIERNF